VYYSYAGGAGGDTPCATPYVGGCGGYAQFMGVSGVSEGPEVMRCVLLCMPDVPEGMRGVLLCMLEVVEGALCLWRCRRCGR